MTLPPHDRLDAAEIALLFQEHADALRRFLRGVTGDGALAEDLVQSAFGKLVEQGHLTDPTKRKAWLFQVAYREALAQRRRNGTQRKVLGNLHQASAAIQRTEPDTTAERLLVRAEMAGAVRQAIAELPEAQQQVLHMRLYKDKTFAQIAADLNIPLGTALGRMRNALLKLRDRLQDYRDDA